ncbi:Kalirin, partial [Geodia barretti]
VCIRFILFLKHLLSFSRRSLPITPPQAGHNQPLWVVLADYPGEEEGTVRVWQGDLVEVIDISRNEWCLIRPVLHSEETAGKKEEEEEEGVGEWEEEGWVPAGFLKPYSGGGFAYPFPRFAPHISTDDESDEEGESLSGDETEPLPLTPEPNLTPYPDPERRAEAAKKLCFIVSELVSSEKDYVARLEFCVQNYITPAQGATAPKPLQTAELFDYLVKIFEFHRDSFLPQLVACQSQPEDLGGVFASSEESLQVYVAYCKAKAASHALLQEHRGFFEELRAQMQDRLELADYLILPVSRITKCSLLLSDFRKQSARSAQSAGQVDEALVVTRGISRQANNAIHLDMLEGLSKMEVGEPVLLDTFKIQAGAKPGSKQRQVFLFPECLLIAKRERGRSYSVKDKLMLQDISMAPDMDPQKKNLIIYDMNSGTKFTLTAAKSSMREQWLSKTQKLIQSAKADTSRSAADNKSRAASEPPELAPHSPTLAKKVTALKNSLVSKKPSFRLGSAKRPDSTSAPSAVPAPTSTVAETSDEPVEGTEYVVMECIVLEGGDDVQLEPGEVVTLVRVEGGGASLRVRTTDAHLTEGTLPATFLRKKTTTNGVDMEAAPKFTMLPSDLDLLYGTTATIACAFNGFPKPSVEWRMNRQTLTSADNRVKITSCATSSILEIIKLCYEDVGTYACFITNSGGSNSAHMALNMHGPPAKVGKPGVSKVTGTSVKLKWSPPDEEGGSPITTYQVEMLQEGFEDWQPIIQQPKTTFIVKALQPSTSYQFRVLACNQYGAGQPSDPSDTVTTKGRGWLSSSPSNTRKKEGTDYPDGGGGGQGLFDDLAGEEGSGSNIMSPPAQFIRRGSIHSEYDVLPEELGRLDLQMLPAQHDSRTKTT